MTYVFVQSNFNQKKAVSVIAYFHGSTGICACLMDLYYSEPVSKYLLQYDKQDRT